MLFCLEKDISSSDDDVPLTKLVTKKQSKEKSHKLKTASKMDQSGKNSLDTVNEGHVPSYKLVHSPLLLIGSILYIMEQL